MEWINIKDKSPIYGEWIFVWDGIHDNIEIGRYKKFDNYFEDVYGCIIRGADLWQEIVYPERPI
jgi:hypothetical protein